MRTWSWDIIREDTDRDEGKYGDDPRRRSPAEVQAELTLVQADRAGGRGPSPSRTRATSSDCQVIPTKRQGRGGRGIKGPNRARATSSSTCSSPTRTIPAVLHEPRARVRRRVYDVPEMTAPARALDRQPALVPAARRSRTCCRQGFRRRAFLMFARQGTLKKTALSAYEHPHQRHHRHRLEGDSLIGGEITSGKDHIILGTRAAWRAVRGSRRPRDGPPRRRGHRRASSARATSRGHDHRPGRQQRTVQGPHRVRKRLRQAHAAGGLSPSRAAARAA
jgi:hypothetical protein